MSARHRGIRRGTAGPRATSIGEPRREIEVVPVEDPVPREIPAEPREVPAEPREVPAEPERVPA
jgi:hypothetical protein